MRFLLFFLTIPLTAATTLDTGWLATLPTVRATNSFVENVAGWTNPLYRKNKALAVAIEIPLAYHFLTWSHELGHADRVVAQGGSYHFETGQTNAWAYLFRNPLTSAAVSWNQVSGAEANIRQGAGFNSTALFAAETKASRVWQTYARLSTILYSPEDASDVDWLSRRYGRSPTVFRSAQVAAAVLTWATPVSADVFFGREDMQVRLRYTYGGCDWSVESPVGKFRPELSVSRRIRSFKITGIVGASVAARVVYQRGRASFGVIYADHKTYFGERVARGSRSIEAYAQWRV